MARLRYIIFTSRLECNGILLPKLFYCEKNNVLVIYLFEITRTIYLNSERSEQFLVIECFFNLFLEVLEFKLEKNIGI